ncbi:MAG TPA: hypothetical protein VI160_04580, partial [Gemmatimonadales bacterium]
TGAEVTWAAGTVGTFVPERTDERGVRRPVTADEFTSCVLRLGAGAFATLTLTTAAHHGTGHWGQITGRDGTLVLSGETKLEMAKAGAPLADASVMDELWERTTPNNMWARSFVRLLRDFAAAAAGARPTGDPATFADGWRIQRVLDAVRAGTATRLD